MDLLSFITFLEKINLRESENLNGRLGRPYGATPQLKRSRKRKRSDVPQYVEIDGKVVFASQPSKAKKKK